MRLWVVRARSNSSPRAAKRYSIPGGQTTVLKIRLAPTRYQIVRKMKKVRVLAIVNGRDVAGNKRKTTKPLVLKPKQPAKRARTSSG